MCSICPLSEFCSCLSLLVSCALTGIFMGCASKPVICLQTNFFLLFQETTCYRFSPLPLMLQIWHLGMGSVWVCGHVVCDVCSSANNHWFRSIPVGTSQILLLLRQKSWHCVITAAAAYNALCGHRQASYACTKKFFVNNFCIDIFWIVFAFWTFSLDKY
jgi:hypothetical protein